MEHIINIKEFEILEFKGKLTGSLFKIDHNNRYGYNKEQITYTLDNMLYDKSGSFISKSFIIKTIKINNKELQIGDFIRIHNINRKIKGFPLLYNEIVLELESDNHWDKIIRLKNIFMNKEDIEPIKSSNEYTLAEIEKILSDVLDKPELKEVIKRFKALKYEKNTVVPKKVKDYLETGIQVKDSRRKYNYKTQKWGYNISEPQ